MQSHAKSVRKNVRLVVGNNLKALRLSRSISQEELARKTGLHRTYISSVERAKRNVSIEALAVLAAALDVKISQIVE
jgi:transcriptional regulator with XRE-family HTH domain